MKGAIRWRAHIQHGTNCSDDKFFVAIEGRDRKEGKDVSTKILVVYVTVI
jgi:hypothetical protein